MSRHVCGWDNEATLPPCPRMARNDASYCDAHEFTHAMLSEGTTRRCSWIDASGPRPIRCGNPSADGKTPALCDQHTALKRLHLAVIDEEYRWESGGKADDDDDLMEAACRVLEAFGVAR